MSDTYYRTYSADSNPLTSHTVTPGAELAAHTVCAPLAPPPAVSTTMRKFPRWQCQNGDLTDRRMGAGRACRAQPPCCCSRVDSHSSFVGEFVRWNFEKAARSLWRTRLFFWSDPFVRSFLLRCSLLIVRDWGKRVQSLISVVPTTFSCTYQPSRQARYHAPTSRTDIWIGIASCISCGLAGVVSRVCL